jgi:vacuolar-type H+-ATPase subunit C/Vma6
VAACALRANVGLVSPTTNHLPHCYFFFQSPLSVSTIEEKLKEKMVAEFKHMRNQAVEPLATFLDFITYSYMIDNVIFLLTGTRHKRDMAEVRAPAAC